MDHPDAFQSWSHDLDDRIDYDIDPEDYEHLQAQTDRRTDPSSAEPAQATQRSHPAGVAAEGREPLPGFARQTRLARVTAQVRDPAQLVAALVGA